MCEIRDTTSKVIELLVNHDEEFTAYDVTEEVRSRLPHKTVFHYKLRQFIHDTMDAYVQGGQYTSEQDFSLHPNGPFVFEPIKTPVTISDVIRPDSRGRICLRKQQIESLSLTPGDKVNVYVQNDTIVVKSSPMGALQNYLATYCVDRDGNIRLGRWLMEQINKKDMPAFVSVKIDSHHTSLIVE